MSRLFGILSLAGADLSALSTSQGLEDETAFAAVSPGSRVLTDGWSGYAGLKTKGYRHSVVRESAVVGENLLPRANRVAALLQRWLLGTHQGCRGVGAFGLLSG